MQLQHAIADEWDCVAVGAGELEFFGVQGQVADVLLQGWELGMAQLTELDVVDALDHVNFQVVEEALGTTEVGHRCDLTDSFKILFFSLLCPIRKNSKI